MRHEALFNNIKKVYSYLDDDESKTIFTNRILWDLTGDIKFIENIPTLYLLDRLT